MEDIPKTIDQLDGNSLYIRRMKASICSCRFRAYSKEGYRILFHWVSFRVKGILGLLIPLILSGGVNAQLIQVVKLPDCQDPSLIVKVSEPKTDRENFCVTYLGKKSNLYYFKTCEALLFEDAEKISLWLHGYMATSNSAELNEFLGKLVPEPHWIGYKQNPLNPNFNDPPDPGSGFEWLSGAPNQDEFWRPGEPDNTEIVHPGTTTVQNCDPNYPGFWCDSEPENRFIGLIESKNPFPPNSTFEVRWSTGQTDNQIKVTDPSLKEISVEVRFQGNTLLESFSLEGLFEEIPVEVPGQTLEFKDGETVYLVAKNRGAFTYSWIDESGQTLSTEDNLKLTPKESQTIKLQIITKTGCTVEETFELILKENMGQGTEKELVFPNAFKPDGNFPDHVFSIYHNGKVLEFSIQIFNRWGNPVFSSNDLNFTWDGTSDGKKLPAGTYALVIDYVTDRPKRITDKLLLIR